MKLLSAIHKKEHQKALAVLKTDIQPLLEDKPALLNELTSLLLLDNVA